MLRRWDPALLPSFPPTGPGPSALPAAVVVAVVVPLLLLACPRRGVEVLVNPVRVRAGTGAICSVEDRGGRSTSDRQRRLRRRSRFGHTLTGRSRGRSGPLLCQPRPHLTPRLLIPGAQVHHKDPVLAQLEPDSPPGRPGPASSRIVDHAHNSFVVIMPCRQQT